MKNRIFGVITAAAMISVAACAADEEPAVEEPVVAPVAAPGGMGAEPLPVGDPNMPVVDPANVDPVVPLPGTDTMAAGATGTLPAPTTTP